MKSPILWCRCRVDLQGQAAKIVIERCPVLRDCPIVVMNQAARSRELHTQVNLQRLLVLGSPRQCLLAAETRLLQV